MYVPSTLKLVLLYYSRMYFTFAVFTGNWLSSKEVWVRLWSSWRELGPSTPRITCPDWMLRNVIVEPEGMLRETSDWATVTRSESSSKSKNLFEKENTSPDNTLTWRHQRHQYNFTCLTSPPPPPTPHTFSWFSPLHWVGRGNSIAFFKLQ